MDAQQLIGEPPCCRTGLARRGQHQVDVPFQARALHRDEPQNAIWCGQHRVLQADWSEADADACADQLEEQFPVADLAGDAARYAFAGERGVTQQAGRPPWGYLDEPLVGELPDVDLCLPRQAVISAAGEVQRLSRQVSHPDAWNLADRGSDHAIQFSRLDHRDHGQRACVLQAQVDAGMIASELAEIGSERYQMLSRQRDADAQGADEYVTGVVYGLFRLRGAGQGPAGRTHQSLACRGEPDGPGPADVQGRAEFAFEGLDRVRQA